MFSVSDSPIEREELVAKLREDRAGALVVFEGWVRDHNQGKRVRSLDYQVYQELAQKEGEKILREAMEKFNLHRVECVHREGALKLGDIAVWIGAVASHRGDAFKATRYIIDSIKSRLPIWKKENYVNEAAEWVSCRDHLHHVHFHESDFYKKQANVVDQDLLRKSKVLVVGAGGLGCPLLSALTAAGVGDIHIVDFDRVEISNLHRQPLYSVNVVGEKKAVVAQKSLSELNPFIHVHSSCVRVVPQNVESLVQGRDLVVDCTDNMESKFLLHDACFKLRVPLVSASIFKKEGQLRTFVPSLDVGCLRCTHSETPDDALLGNCNDFGVLGASVAVLGSLQASEALELLQTGSNATLRETFYFNLKDLSQFKVRNVRSATCRTCSGEAGLGPSGSDMEIGIEELTGEFELVDIRDRDDAFLEQFTDKRKRVVIYCHRGIRSKGLVKRYRDRGFTHFYSLVGGACSL